MPPAPAETLSKDGDKEKVLLGLWCARLLVMSACNHDTAEQTSSVSSPEVLEAGVSRVTVFIVVMNFKVA